MPDPIPIMNKEATPVQASFLIKDKELMKISHNEMDFFKTEELDKEKDGS